MEEKNTMMDFMDEIDKSMRTLDQDDWLDGTILSVEDEDVLVDINYTSDGIIPKAEWIEGYDYKVGDRISVYVLNPHDQNGNVILSHRRGEEIAGWNDLEEAYEQKKKLFVTVTGVVKGGVSASYRKINCFIPGSLLSYRYVEDMSTYVGRELEVIVEDFDREKKRVVLSRKAVETVERQKQKKQLMEHLHEGEMRQGVVTKLMKFGAFVDLGGVEGLIHLDDLAWHRVNDPAEVVSEGDAVTVYVGKIDSKTGKIGLVLKKIEDDPWQGISEHYKVGDFVEGTVVRLANFGAFIEIENGIEGLVHLSELSQDRVKKPSDVVNVGDRVRAMILRIQEAEKRISLSIKDAEGHVDDDVELPQEDVGTTLGDLFGDKFKDFFK